MLRRATITGALAILGTLSAGVLRAADQPGQDPCTEKQESVTERMQRATKTAAEQMKVAAQTASNERSDSWITLKTTLSLFADERVRGNAVHVTTRQGVIVLTGEVGTDQARRATEEIAAKIARAKRVENHVAVVPNAAQKANDRKDGRTGTTSTAVSGGTRA
jgi:osmotically-inducible protein OsmY